jgi:hypothetical protein
LMTQAPDVFGFQNLKEMNIVGGEEMCWERTHITYVLILVIGYMYIYTHTQTMEIDIAVINFTFWGREGGLLLSLVQVKIP